MIKKLVTLSNNVAERLSQEDNQSAVVDSLLATHYNLTLPEDGWHMAARKGVAPTMADVLSEPTSVAPDLNTALTEPTPEESVLSDLEPVETPVVEETEIITESLFVPVVPVSSVPVPLPGTDTPPAPATMLDQLANPETQTVATEPAAPTPDPTPPVEDPILAPVDVVPTPTTPVDEIAPAETTGQVPDAEIPINVNGQPAVQTAEGDLVPKCPTCGQPKPNSICLNCL